MSNINRIISLALKPGNEYMREVLTRLVIFAAAFFVATILIIIGMVFLVWSSFLYLSTVLNPYLAALISGLIAILLALNIQKFKDCIVNLSPSFQVNVFGYRK